MRAPTSPVHAPAPRRDRPACRVWYIALAWSFAVFNSLRLIAYFPTMWAIYASGDSQQHAWFTWLTWTGANATMAAWLFEHEGRRITRAIIVNVSNALMCLVTLLLIVLLRI